LILDFLFEHFSNFVNIVAHSAEDPDDGQIKNYGQTVYEAEEDWVIASEV